MNAFDSEADLEHDLDFRLLINTAVSLFHRRPVLDETTTWLAEQGYQVTILDASSWSSEADFHAAISEALDFPSYYGRNLDALNGCRQGRTSTLSKVSPTCSTAPGWICACPEPRHTPL